MLEFKSSWIHIIWSHWCLFEFLLGWPNTNGLLPKCAVQALWNIKNPCSQPFSKPWFLQEAKQEVNCVELTPLMQVFFLVKVCYSGLYLRLVFYRFSLLYGYFIGRIQLIIHWYLLYFRPFWLELFPILTIYFYGSWFKHCG